MTVHVVEVTLEFELESLAEQSSLAMALRQAQRDQTRIGVAIESGAVEWTGYVKII